jgi:hypothetical protein
VESAARAADALDDPLKVTVVCIEQFLTRFETAAHLSSLI